MQPFPCSVCQQLLFFDNSTCLRCGSRLGYLPDEGRLVAVRTVADGRGTRRWHTRHLPRLREPARRALQLVDSGRRPCLVVCELSAHVGSPERQRGRFARSVRRCRGGQAAAAPSADGTRASRRRQVRRRRARRVVRTAVVARSERDHRTRFRRDHPRPLRVGRRAPRVRPTTTGRAVSHRARPPPPRDRPLLLGSPRPRHRSPRRVSHPLR